MTDHTGPTNARPIAIFIGYLAAASILTWQSISVIRAQRQKGRSLSLGKPRRQRKVVVFSLLAIASLCTTWYYMFAFFAFSYREWAAQHPELAAPSSASLGLWLRDTSLFKLAWGSAMSSDTRFWWTQQIFGFCSSWSVLLSVQGTKHQIPSFWIFVLLGQVVAISFASNLSFLAIILSPTPEKQTVAKRGQDPKKANAPQPSTRASDVALYGLIAVNLACVGAIPFIQEHPSFLTVLLMPHILAFVPLVMSPSPGSIATSLAVLGAAVLQVHTTMRILSSGSGLANIIAAFHEHPAVSSVGWDVIMCWISYCTWYILQE